MGHGNGADVEIAADAATAAAVACIVGAASGPRLLVHFWAHDLGPIRLFFIVNE